jgi:hypothetical protein
MFLAKLFGARLFGAGRSEAERQDLADDEPTYIPGHSPPRIGLRRDGNGGPGRATQPAATLPGSPSSYKESARSRRALGAGFDPYNSGAFNRAQAWERTSKR